MRIICWIVCGLCVALGAAAAVSLWLSMMGRAASNPDLAQYVALPWFLALLFGALAKIIGLIEPRRRRE